MLVFFLIILFLDSIVIWRLRKKQYKCNRQKKMKRKSWKSAQKIYSDVFLDIIVYRGSLWRFYLTWYLCMLFLSKTRDIDEYMTMIFKWSFSLALNQQMIFLDIQQLIIFLKVVKTFTRWFSVQWASAHMVQILSIQIWTQWNIIMY